MSGEVRRYQEKSGNVSRCQEQRKKNPGSKVALLSGNVWAIAKFFVWYDRKIILSLFTMNNFQTHTGNFKQFGTCLWHIIKNYNSSSLNFFFILFQTQAGYFLKSGNFQTHAWNFQAHAGNFNQSRNLFCYMIVNKFNVFVLSKFPDTYWKFQDPTQKFLPISKF